MLLSLRRRRRRSRRHRVVLVAVVVIVACSVIGGCDWGRPLLVKVLLTMLYNVLLC